MMIIDFSEYLGLVLNDTGIYGKAFIFKVITDKDGIPYVFDTILFVHERLDPFLSLAEEDSSFNKEDIMKHIFDKYTLQQLLMA